MEQPIDRCGGKVTASCPFTGKGGSYFNNYYQGSEIVQLEYAPSGNNLCVAQRLSLRRAPLTSPSLLVTDARSGSRPVEGLRKDPIGPWAARILGNFFSRQDTASQAGAFCRTLYPLLAVS